MDDPRPQPGARSSSQSFISRFWRQKLRNDEAPNPAEPGMQMQRPPLPPPPQYWMGYSGQQLDPPRVSQYNMPATNSPAASPNPPPPGGYYQSAEQPANQGYGPPSGGYPTIPVPRTMQAPGTQLIQASDGQVHEGVPRRPTPASVPGVPVMGIPVADPASGSTAPTPHVPSPTESPVVGAYFATDDHADQALSVVQPSIATSSVRGKSPDLRPQDPPEEAPVPPSTPRAIGLATLAPPVSNLPLDASPGLSPGTPAEGFFPGSKPNLGQAPKIAEVTETETSSPTYYDPDKPTCSLNLVCYRSGAKGCELQQLQGILRERCSSDESFEAAKARNKRLVVTDDQFFQEMERLYETEMCGFLRRHFSLKTLKAFRVLSYTPVTRPSVVPFDDFILQEMMFAYRNADKVSSTRNDWVQWMFRLRRKDKRHALEFVEGWNTSRIAIAGTVPLLSSCLVGIGWTANGGDAQTAFTVASFILTASSIILALLAIISSIESSGPKH